PGAKRRRAPTAAQRRREHPSVWHSPCELGYPPSQHCPAMNPDHHCTFCDLIHGAGEVSICYEDADSIAFMDVQPVNPGHVLVVSRRHYENLEDVPEQLAMHLIRVATNLAPAVKKVADSEWIHVVVNSGSAAAQD